MLYLKEANYEYIEKEYLFVRDMPTDENGFTNEWHDISREEFEKKATRSGFALYKDILFESYIGTPANFV